MKKINQEEYEVLKELDDKWKWIARDGECNSLNVFSVKPIKTPPFQWDYMDVDYKHAGLTKEENKMFQIIQWEDEEPHNIDELIEEYEHSAEHVSHVVNKRVEALGKAWNESEEAEVRNIQWLKEEVINQNLINKDGYIYAGNLTRLLDQLDEPEVLSQKWISENVEYAYFDVLDGSERLSSATAIIRPKKLQNLLVPKQDKPVIPQFVADYYNEYKHHELTFAEWYEEQGEGKGSRAEEETFEWLLGKDYEEGIERQYILADIIAHGLDGYEIEKEPRYYVAFEGELNLLYVTHVDIYGENGKFNYNSKSNRNHALKFTDKSRAKYLADFLGAIVVEVTE